MRCGVPEERRCTGLRPVAVCRQMSVNPKSARQKKADRWAEQIMASVDRVLAKHPGADPDNVRHTLILLEQPPLERLKRSLLRGRALVKRK